MAFPLPQGWVREETTAGTPRCKHRHLVRPQNPSDQSDSTTLQLKNIYLRNLWNLSFNRQLFNAGWCGVKALQPCCIKTKDHEARAPCFKGRRDADRWWMLFIRHLFYQTSLPRARDQADVVLQLHKGFLLFQCWLKLLSPAERGISYTDGSACVAKTQQQRGRKCVTHNSTTESRLTEGSLFTHTAFPFSAGTGSTGLCLWVTRQACSEGK